MPRVFGVGGLSGDLLGELPEQPKSDEPRAMVFGMAAAIATQSGRKEAQVRAQLGSMLKQYTPERVLGALSRAQTADDPLNYARALLRGKRPAANDGREAFLRRHSER